MDAGGVSNHAEGDACSAPIDAGPNQCYLLGAWLRGEIDQEDAYNGWIVRLEFYNGEQSLGWQDAASGRWINPDWTYVEGRVQSPPGTNKARVKLFGEMTSGWITYDDVTLRACGGGGLGAPGGGGVTGEPSPEDLLAEAEPHWQIEAGTPCLDGEACPPGSEVDEEPPIEVQWAPASEIDAAIVRELMGQEESGGAEPGGTIESGGTTVIKRYVLGGRVVAMRRGEKLYFLSADHLGSGSVILDDQGRWLADQRFFPYGETKRLDGASESYPTDRLFTGMGFRDTLGLYRMGARWYDPYIARWLSADTLVPDPGNPQSLNRYSYVTNGPLRYRDASGHCPQCAVAAMSAPFGPPGWLVGGALILALTVGGVLLADAAMDAAHTSSQPALQASGGVAYPNPPPPDDPFRDLSEAAQNRIKSHRAMLENPRVNPAYKHGLRAQLQRAEELARQGQLEDYEASFGRNRFDLTLKGGDRVIEVKYWTQSYTQSHLDSLVDQLMGQQAAGKEVILNMYQTQGDSITWEYWTQLLEELATQGVNLSEESSLLCLVP